ncbi:MAG TPA: D-glycerate dehydrogenase [Verrucomicrobiae bacterium]|nr:D-glycerate dehydrogenase [Verrucomicrobiae bacterium]
MKPKVFLTRQLPPAVMERLERETDLAWHREDRVATKAEVIAGTQGREALLCTILDRVDGELLDACPGLKVVANFGVGFNNIDVAAATARKIPVTNTPGVLTDATADMTFALLLAVARRLGEGERIIRAHKWEGWQPLQLLASDVTGATLGLIGFGRIGQAVARRARAFGMRVIYWNRSALSELGSDATPVSFEETLRQSDFVSLHVAYNSETHHLLDEPQFALMKTTAFVINTARGAVINETALVRALQTKQIAGAALDVFEREPQLAPGLADLENVVLAPHLGSATIGTRTKMGMIAVDNLLAICESRRPPNCVNPEVFA